MNPAQPRAHWMPRQGWIVFGALAGGIVTAVAAPFVAWGVLILFHSPQTSAPWGTIAMMAGGPLGLLAGGLVGSRVPGMGWRTRIALTALGGAVLLAAVGGLTGLGVCLSSEYGCNSGMRDSMIGVAGAIGLGIAGAFGALVLRGVRGRR